MTPTEAINTLYYDDMDILHIDNWRFFTPKKRDRWYTPKTETIPHLLCPALWILKNGPNPQPLFKSAGLVPKSIKTIARSQIKWQAVKFAPTI